MRTIYMFTVLLFLFVESIQAQEDNCFRATTFGESKVCLPEIQGYVECYQDSIVKYLADATEVEANVVLGYYVNNETFESKENIGIVRLNDYFKVYGTKQIKDYKADASLLVYMKELLDGNFIVKNWDTMKKGINELELDIEIGTPTVINSYELNDSSFTFIMLTRYEPAGEEPYTLAMTVNGYLHNNRLVWMAYYHNYVDEDTIPKLEEKSNFILTELINTQN